MKDSFLWILERSGFSTFAQQAKIGFSLPGSIIDVMWRATPDWELIKNMDLQLIFGQFQLRDWTETAVDFFLAHVPLDFATKCFVNLLSRVAPPLVPVFARMEALRIHPVQVVRFLQQSPSYLKYGREFLEELYTWVFEMSRCLFDYLAKMIKYYFGFEEAETSVAGTKDTLPCCMLQIMDDLQKWSKGETPAQRLQANVLRSFSDDRRQVTDDLTKIRLEKGADSPEFRTAYMDSKQFCYDGFAADFWSTACVVSELFLCHELFTFHAGQDLMVHYERLCLFSRNMQNGAAEGGGTSTSQHPLVKILKRRVPKEYAEFVWPLLRGSFSLDPSDRRSAINTFLDDPKIRNLVK